MMTRENAAGIAKARADEADKLNAMAIGAPSRRIKHLFEEAANASRESSKIFHQLTVALPIPKKAP